MQIYSFSPFGYEGSLVTVEVDLRRGIPAIDIVGLADNAVKESRERMQVAIKNSGFDFPCDRVLISLSPADLKKEGAGFDLPIALGVLACSRADEIKNVEPLLVMGELELSGKIRNVRGVHAAVSTAFECGITKCIVPSGNADEAREVLGMKVFGADCLENAFLALNNSLCFTEGKSKKTSEDDLNLEGSVKVGDVWFGKIEDNQEFDEVAGQKELIRGLQIAACGGHNLIAVGSPGCGKTMALQKIQGLLPLLTNEESQSITRIMSLAGLLPSNESIIRIPPLRMPHQTATIEGMCGGGPLCRPGEISLAHNGVLFLDEAGEFKSSVLQMLRVPIESGRITLSRAGRSTVFPANFQLIMAANPCPCGNLGSTSKICLCSSRAIELYWKKFSGPLLDRIDIRIPIENSCILENENEIKNNGEKNNDQNDKKLFKQSTEELRKKIAEGVSIQRKRQNCKNAKLSSSQIDEFCKLDKNAENFLTKNVEKFNFSPRGISSVLRVSRTIADMEGRENIIEEDIIEACSFRKGLDKFIDFC